MPPTLTPADLAELVRQIADSLVRLALDRMDIQTVRVEITVTCD